MIYLVIAPEVYDIISPMLRDVIAPAFCCIIYRSHALRGSVE